MKWWVEQQGRDGDLELYQGLYLTVRSAMLWPEAWCDDGSNAGKETRPGRSRYGGIVVVVEDRNRDLRAFDGWGLSRYGPPEKSVEGTRNWPAGIRFNTSHVRDRQMTSPGRQEQPGL